MDIKSLFLFLLLLVVGYNALLAVISALITEGMASGQVGEICKRVMNFSAPYSYFLVVLAFILVFIFVLFHPETSPMGMVYFVFLCTLFIVFNTYKSFKNRTLFVEKNLSFKYLWLLIFIGLMFILLK